MDECTPPIGKATVCAEPMGAMSTVCQINVERLNEIAGEREHAGQNEQVGPEIAYIHPPDAERDISAVD